MNPNNERNENQSQAESSETSNPPSDHLELEEVDYSTLISEEDDAEGDLGESPTAEKEEGEVAGAAPEPEVQAEETPPEPEAAEQEEEAEEKAEEPEQEKGELPEPEPLPEVKMPSREEIEGMYTEHREKTLPELEKLFKLSDEQVESLQDNPGEVLPKLAAQIMYDSMMSSYNAVTAVLPSVVNRLITVSEETRQAETAFFDRWQELRDPKLRPVVEQSIRAYRSANPSAKLDEVIERAGTLAMMQAGLDPTKRKEDPKPRPRPKPAKPAGAGGSASPMPPPPKSQEESNIFADLTDAFQKEFG